MRVCLPSELIEGIGEKWFAEFTGQEERESSRWRHYDREIALPNFTDEQLDELVEKIKPLKKSRSCVSLIKKFKEMRRGKHPKASGAKQMQVLLESFIAQHAPGFKLYQEESGHHLTYYVDRVVYHPEQKDRGNYYPAHVDMHLLYVQDGKVCKDTESWSNSACYSTAPKLLADSGYLTETPDLLQEYNDAVERYAEICNEIGMQCLATGWAWPEVRWGASKIKVDAHGPANVVIDLVDDDEESSKNHKALIHSHMEHPYQWERKKQALAQDVELEHDEEDEGFYEEDDEIKEILLPLHPYVHCFDLRRHQRMQIHAMDLEDYIYDKKLDQKLVIPEDVKQLIRLLSESGGKQFKDIVSGKSGGTTILLAGPPGVGKTLTAEVFSEAVEKPLYRIQCSQLGISPESIEEKLQNVFSRANRWGAIILLDESDVYVQKRGEDLNRNAIVGVFLRVMEYQETVMFMTTNLPESVDDAIASRCIARVDYERPTEAEALKIWRILTEASGVNISPAVLNSAVEELPGLAGRDIKMILKLLHAKESEQKELSLEAIKIATKFHPNRGNWQ